MPRHWKNGFGMFWSSCHTWMIDPFDELTLWQIDFYEQWLTHHHSCFARKWLPTFWAHFQFRQPITHRACIFLRVGSVAKIFLMFHTLRWRDLHTPPYFVDRSILFKPLFLSRLTDCCSHMNLRVATIYWVFIITFKYTLICSTHWSL